MEKFADEPLVGDALFGGLALYRIELSSRQAQVDARVLRLKLEAVKGHETRKIVFRKIRRIDEILGLPIGFEPGKLSASSKKSVGNF